MMIKQAAIFIGLIFLASTWLCACNQVAEEPWEAERAAKVDKQVREQMRTVQLAAEHYAADHGSDNYPTTLDDMFKTYFPGGTDGKRPSPIGPANPFTGENEFPIIASEITDVEAVRHGKRFDMKPGQITYTPLDRGRSYAIVGGAHDGKVLMDENNPDQVLVFSNI